MILYFAPLSCSMVVRIVANELQVPLTYTQVEVFTKTMTADGSPYKAIAPLELVPLLDLGGGNQLTEVNAIIQYLAESQSTTTELLPSAGTLERYRTLRWLSFGATEIHKRILWPIVNRETPREVKQHARSLAPATFEFLAQHLLHGNREYLACDHFTLADAYFAWAFAVTPFLLKGIDVPPALAAYVERVHARPSVRDALAIEMPLLEKVIDTERRRALRRQDGSGSQASADSPASK